MRKATTFDTPKIKSLWKKVFGDSEDYISSFIAHFGIETCYVCELNHEIISIAFALPTTLKLATNGNAVQNSKFKILPLRYLYACATHPEHQNQGIMKNLLATIYDEVCRENIAGIFLNAANKNLANYYRKLEFEDFFFREHFWYNKDRLLSNALDITKTFYFISPETYYKKRVQKLKNNSYVNWNENFFRFNNETKIQFCEFGHSIFSFKTLFNTIIIDELLGDASHEQIAKLLIKHFPKFETIHIRLPGSKTCCGQMKWCNFQEDHPKNVYFAFAME